MPLYTFSYMDAQLAPLAAFTPEIYFILSTESTIAGNGGWLISNRPVKGTLLADGSGYVVLVSNDQIQNRSHYKVRAKYRNSAGEPVSMDLFSFFARVEGGPISNMVEPSLYDPAQLIVSEIEPESWPIGWVWANPLTGDVNRRTAVGIEFLGNWSGKKGDKGDPGPQGPPGFEEVPTDPGIATLVNTPSSLTGKAVDKKFTRPGVPASVLSFTVDGTRNKNAAAIMRPVYAGFAKADTQRCQLGILGDSWTASVGASGWDKGFPAQLAAGLRREFTPTRAVGGRGYMAADQLAPVIAGHGVSIGGGAAAASTLYGAARGCVALGTGYVEFTVIGTTARVFYLKRPGPGSFKVTVDGTDGVTTTTNAVVETDGNFFDVALGAAGSHVIRLTGVVAGAYVEGIDISNGDLTAGIKVHALGKGGWTAQNFYAGGTVDPVGQWPAALAALSLNVILVALGTNDIGQRTAAQFQTDLHNFCSLLRGYFPNTTIIIIAVGAPQSFESVYPDYAQSMYNVSELIGKSVVADLSLRMPQYDSDGTWANPNHPNDAGHKMLAMFLQSFLLPS